MVLLLFSRLTARQKETQEMALDEVGIKQSPFLLLGGCLSPLGGEKSLSSLLTCSHVGQVVCGRHDVYYKGSSRELQTADIPPTDPSVFFVRSYSLPPPKQQQ